jgi:hypothetical protein
MATAVFAERLDNFNSRRDWYSKVENVHLTAAAEVLRQ